MIKKCICGHEMTKAEWKHQWVCHRCGRTQFIYDDITNAEYIRSLTNDEMAEWLVQKVKCTACNGNGCSYDWCVDHMKKWLKNPCKKAKIFF